MNRGPENEDEKAAEDAGRAPLGFITVPKQVTRQADRQAARETSIQKVAEFLKLNYPCDCEQDCGFPDENEAKSIVEMVEAEFFTNDQVCKHCKEPIYLDEWRWRHTNGMYSCELSAETVRMPRGTRPRAEP